MKLEKLHDYDRNQVKEFIKLLNFIKEMKIESYKKEMLENRVNYEIEVLINSVLSDQVNSLKKDLYKEILNERE